MPDTKKNALAELAEMKERTMETDNETAENDAEIAKLTADNMRMKSLLNKAGETVVGLMNKMSAQDEEIKKLRALVKEMKEGKVK